MKKRTYTIYQSVNKFGERGGFYTFSPRGKERIVELFLNQVLIHKPTFPHTTEKFTIETADFILDDSCSEGFKERFKKEIFHG